MRTKDYLSALALVAVLGGGGASSFAQGASIRELAPTATTLVARSGFMAVDKHTDLAAESSVRTFSREPWGIRVLLTNDVEWRVYVYAPEVVRVRQVFAGEDAEADALVDRVALVRTLPKFSEFSLTEDQTQIQMATMGERLQLLVQKKPFQVTFKNKAGEVLTLQKASLWKNETRQTRGVTLKAFANERYLGIGGHGDYSINRRGINARIWNTHIDPDKGNDYQNPIFLSSRGYAFLALNSYEAWLRLNHQGDGNIVYETTGGRLDYILFQGGDPKHLLATYHWLTGFAPLPPRWAFGLWMSRTSGDESWAQSTVKEFRQREIPLDMLHLEGIPSWTHIYPGHESVESLWAFFDQWHIRKGLWQGEVLSKKYSEEWWKDADSAGFFTKDKSGRSYLVPHFGNPAIEHSVVDFGSESAFQWFKSKHEHLLNLGYDNVMVDGGLEEEQIPKDMVFESGRFLGAEYHNLFAQIWVERVRQIQLSKSANKRPMAYVRGGWTGVHRYATSWGGDQCWTFDSMKNLIRKAISESLVGVSFWSQDSGGFFACWQKNGEEWTRPPRTRRFYERSVQWGAWNPIFRIHGEHHQGVGNDPWQFGAASEKIVSEAIRERYRLLPYFYSLAHQARHSGVPMLRAMPLEFPSDVKTWNLSDQHMVGSELLVAPITSTENTRAVYLPAGEWFDYYQPSTKFAGGKSIQYTTDETHIPVFVKAGSVIPKAPLTQFVADGPSRSELILTAYRGPASTFWLYEDDGISRDYESGAFVTSKIERWREGKSESVRIYPPEGSYPGSERRRHLTFKIYGYKKTNLKSCRIDQKSPIDCDFVGGAIVAEVDWDSTNKGEALTFVVDLK